MQVPDERELLLESQLLEYEGRFPLSMLLSKLLVLKELTEERGDITRSHHWAQQIINEATKEKLGELEGDELRYAVGTLRKAYMYRAREDFETFLKAMEWDRDPSQRFYQPRQSVLKGVVKQMQALADGKLDVLGVSMPPRAGKTTLGILFICWLGGRFPNKSVLSAGYSSSLVQSFYDGAGEFISSPEYCFGDIFPESPLVSSNAKNLTLDLAQRRRYKTLTFRSIDGTVTGATEASSLLYLDDLVSGIEEATNLNRLESLWAKVSSDMLQRRKDGVPMLIIGTRWSLHDPLGKIELKYENDPRAHFMKLPAVDEYGNSNFDYAYNVGYSTEHYETLKNMTDEVTWQCVYMQNPIEREGLLFDDLKRFFEIPPTEPDDIFFWVDVAFGGVDYLAMPIAYQWGDDVYIVDTVFMRGDYKLTQPIVVGKILAHKARRGVFEANNGGDFYARDISEALKKEGYKCNITTERATSKNSKLSRIIQHAPTIKEFYYRDKSLYRNDEMYGVMMNQLTSFVQSGQNRHDDAPDSLAGLSTMLRHLKLRPPIFMDRRAIGL